MPVGRSERKVVLLGAAFGSFRWDGSALRTLRWRLEEKRSAGQTGIAPFDGGFACHVKRARSALRTVRWRPGVSNDPSEGRTH